MPLRPLFSDASIFDIVLNQKERLRASIQGLIPSQLNEPEIIERLVAEFELRVPTLDETNKYGTESNTEIVGRRHPIYSIYEDAYVGGPTTGVVLTIHIPFEGDGGLFQVRPSTFDNNPPLGEVVGQELCLEFSPILSGETLQPEIQKTIDAVKKYLDWQRPSAPQLHNELVQQATSMIDKLRSEAATRSDVLSKLNIPIRRAEPASEPRAKPRPATPPVGSSKTTKWDVFISHASEDKQEIAAPLATALRAKGLEVWYDDFTLKLGDSLRASIDLGLANSRYGIVILSPDFFKKRWTENELNGLVALEAGRRKVILPIWHKVSEPEVRGYSPILADRKAASTDEGFDSIVRKILEVFSPRNR